MNSRWALTVSFAELLQRLHAQKHTGPVTLHFLHGQPKLVDLPSEPTQIAIDVNGCLMQD